MPMSCKTLHVAVLHVMYIGILYVLTFNTKLYAFLSLIPDKFKTANKFVVVKNGFFFLINLNEN